MNLILRCARNTTNILRIYSVYRYSIWDLDVILFFQQIQQQFGVNNRWKTVLMAEVLTDKEAYAFAGWIFTIVGYAVFLLWAYLPDDILHSYGYTYYPSR